MKATIGEFGTIPIIVGKAIVSAPSPTLALNNKTTKKRVNRLAVRPLLCH